LRLTGVLSSIRTDRVKGVDMSELCPSSTVRSKLFAAALGALLIAGAPAAFGQTRVPEPGGGTQRDDDTVREGETTADAAEDKREDGDRRLSDRIKSVQRKVFLKKNRLEIFPFFQMALNDPFFHHFAVGLAAGYHIADSFNIEVRGSYVVGSTETSAVKLIRVTEKAVFDQVPKFKWNGDLNFGWSPIYGKVSLAGEWILHFDTYISLGLGVFGHETGGEAAFSPAANVAIGERVFLTEWLTLRLELRDYIFHHEREEIADIQNLLMFGVSLSGFFPTSFEYEFQ